MDKIKKMAPHELLAKMTHWSLEERETANKTIDAMISRLKQAYAEEYDLEIGEGSKRSKGKQQMSTIPA